ncbi:MAG: lipid A 3-O-deacylase [Psychromonas sp.]|jgi:lipid A 3-O-deacylase|uniref:lipid A deacylase LpxR family protein n=1 Tax=Psychromonas sp. TaxID=1884585 RepID=UPI0039E227A9
MNKLIIVLIIIFTPLSYAENDVDFFGVTLENDFFFNDDGLYTNGLIATWGYDDVERLDEQALPDWLAYLAQKSYLNKQQDKRYAITYTVAQLIQTAIDDSVEELIAEDSPYVGMLAWEGQLTAYDHLTLDRLTLILGMVGPVASAEFTQTAVHNVVDARDTRGWGNQIGNEAVFRVQADRLWRIYDKTLGNTEFDVVSGVNAGIGNFRSDIGAGVGLRWGQELQNSFLSASAFPIQKLNRPQHSPNGWYFFVNSAAFYVANDIFMNGNTFQDSHSVSLIHQQFSISTGFMVNLYHWSIVYTLFQQSAQYQGQNEASRYGSITVSYNFD